MEKLPEELFIFEIFPYLTVKDLILVERTCKIFHLYANNQNMWKVKCTCFVKRYIEKKKSINDIEKKINKLKEIESCWKTIFMDNFYVKFCEKNSHTNKYSFDSSSNQRRILSGIREFLTSNVNNRLNYRTGGDYGTASLNKLVSGGNKIFHWQIRSIITERETKLKSILKGEIIKDFQESGVENFLLKTKKEKNENYAGVVVGFYDVVEYPKFSDFSQNFCLGGRGHTKSYCISLYNKWEKWTNVFIGKKMVQYTQKKFEYNDIISMILSFDEKNDIVHVGFMKNLENLGEAFRVKKSVFRAGISVHHSEIREIKLLTDYDLIEMIEMKGFKNYVNSIQKMGKKEK